MAYLDGIPGVPNLSVLLVSMTPENEQYLACCFGKSSVSKQLLFLFVGHIAHESYQRLIPTLDFSGKKSKVNKNAVEPAS